MGAGRLARSPARKPTKGTLFTMILCNSEKSIRDIRPFCRPSFVRAVLWSILHLSYSGEPVNETWLPSITEIPPLNLLAWSALDLDTSFQQSLRTKSTGIKSKSIWMEASSSSYRMTSWVQIWATLLNTFECTQHLISMPPGGIGWPLQEPLVENHRGGDQTHIIHQSSHNR